MRVAAALFAACLALSGLALPGVARAAIVEPYAADHFAAAQQAGAPILVFIEAPWCPTCARERPILAKLYDEAQFKDLRVFTVDYDSSKPLLRSLRVQTQSTLLAFRGTAETGRATGLTDPAAIQSLLESTAKD